jgi:hypothetical protein
VTASDPALLEPRLQTARNIWLATVRPDGRPHLVPVWFVYAAGRLYVCTEPESVKARNLAGNGAVALALEDGNRPVICEGEARPVARPWPEPVVAAFAGKYDWDLGEETRYTLLVEVAPHKWLSW